MSKTLHVIMGPTYSGKTTVIKQITAAHPTVKRLITNTTRPPREHEVNGQDYNFVTNREAITAQDEGTAIAPRTYHVQTGDYWTYYVDGKSLANLPSEDTLIITDMTGYQDLKNYVNSHPETNLAVKGWFVETDLMTIFKRIANSDRNHENPKETLRRLYDDIFNVFDLTDAEFNKLGITAVPANELINYFDRKEKNN